MIDVLVVEDDLPTLEALIRFLHQKGHTARGACTPQIALLEIHVKCPDVIISDWDLGDDTSGVHVVSYAIRCKPQVQVVMVSGNNLSRLQAETSELPIYSYLRKPYSLNEMGALFSSDH